MHGGATGGNAELETAARAIDQKTKSFGAHQVNYLLCWVLLLQSLLLIYSFVVIFPNYVHSEMSKKYASHAD